MTCEHTWEWVKAGDGRRVGRCLECGAITADPGPKGGEWSWRRNWAFYCTCGLALALLMAWAWGWV